MKKVLFCAGILALAVSCTDDFDTLSMQQDGQIEKTEAKKGISFEAAIGVEPSTRADMSFDEKADRHLFFWFAEQDRLKVWSTNTTAEITDAEKDSQISAALEDWKTKVSSTDEFVDTPYEGYPDLFDDSGSLVTVEDQEAAFKDWAKNNFDFTSTHANEEAAFDYDLYATYKATRSATNGYFTAINDENLLQFPDDSDKDKQSRFFMMYPEATMEDISLEGGNTIFEISGLPPLAGQVQVAKSNENIAKSVFMISDTEGYAEKSYNSVGEKLNVNFVRPFTAAVYTTKGHETDFGPLTKVKLEAKGATGVAASILDYGNASLRYNSGDKTFVLTKSDGSPIVVKDNAAETKTNWEAVGGKSSIDLTVDGMDDWSDESFAYMAMNYIGRSAFTVANPETMEATFTFENLEPLTRTIKSSNNWPAKQGNNQFMNIELDFSDFKYLVTNSTGARSLYIYQNLAFDDIFAVDGDDILVKWSEKEIALSEFTAIKVVNEEAILDNDILAELKGFENIEMIQLGGNTTIPAETFKDLSNLTKIVLPATTSIAPDAFDGTTLVVVITPAFDYTNQELPGLLLNPASLEYLDMSGANQIGGVEWLNTNFKLAGYNKLETVVAKDDLVVGFDAFKGCSDLENILSSSDDSKGRVFAQLNLAGTNAFENCVVLDTIAISVTDIPNYVFKGCEDLSGILYKDTKEQVKPTSVGVESFFDCKALENISLVNASSIEESAFSGCVKMYGFEENSNGNIRKVLTIGAGIVRADAFRSTGVQYVKFTNPVAIYPGLFASASSMLQVRFEGLFTMPADTYKDKATFGPDPSSKIDLFVNKDQAGINASRLTMPGITDGVLFKSINVIK